MKGEKADKVYLKNGYTIGTNLSSQTENKQYTIFELTCEKTSSDPQEAKG